MRKYLISVLCTILILVAPNEAVAQSQQAHLAHNGVKYGKIMRQHDVLTIMSEVEERVGILSKAINLGDDSSLLTKELYSVICEAANLQSEGDLYGEWLEADYWTGTQDWNVISISFTGYETITKEFVRVKVNIDDSDWGTLSTKLITFVLVDGEWLIDDLTFCGSSFKEYCQVFVNKYKDSVKVQSAKLQPVPVKDTVSQVVVEKKILPPPPQAKKIVDIIKVIEEDVEIEESELVPVQGVSEYADVEETDIFFIEEEVDGGPVLDVVEEMPEFPGGMKELMKYLSENIKYPAISRANNSQGKTFTKFTVNKDGSLQDFEVVRSSGDIYLDKEAIRVVKAMPKWKPGRQMGKAVRVKYVLPVNFRLQ